MSNEDDLILEFSEYWNAPFLESAEEIKATINSFNLPGRRIKRIKAIGHDYGHNRDSIVSVALNQFEGLPIKEQISRSDYPTIYPNAEFVRHMEIDEPLLIEFEDGDIFAIVTDSDDIFSMCMNEIPWNTKPEINEWNVDANVMLSPCIGQKITRVDVDTTSGTHIILHLENGVQLELYAYVSYFCVLCLNENGEVLKIKYKELKRGLYNYEDLYYDAVTGFYFNKFCFKGSTLYFGDKGLEYIDEEYMYLYSSANEKSRGYIPINHFIVLDWCISLFIKDHFDMYDDYNFTYDEWQALLDKADSLLAIDSFDSLFNELIKLQGDNDFMLFKLNKTGADFWEDRDTYRHQLNALREWSDLVLKQGDTMFVIGF